MMDEQRDHEEEAYNARILASGDGEIKLCRWFAMCLNEATTTVAHPVLGDVPCCARCAKLAND